MPTQHIEPACAELLQDVANSLLKSRKVVVVTGAGISTNSGIPDFRSENGLYSLIQAQLDAAARNSREQAQAQQTLSEKEDEIDERDDEPPSKRRKTSSIPDDVDEAEGEVEVRVEVDSVTTQTATTNEVALPAHATHETSVTTIESTRVSFSTPKPRRIPLSLEHLMTSPLSSPPPEDSIIPPSVFRNSRLADMAFPFSSSPLSSPPPNLFDPFCPSSPSDDEASPRSSSPSEDDTTPQSSVSNPFNASQSSYSGRTTLPNMKGKDLFDASIWADPLRTSVFYTFATTLRQKIREVKPTSSHHFISHLRDRGKLVRCYTQNIDQIEEKVGLSTTLDHGPGARGRFSRRSTTNSQLTKMVEELAEEKASAESSDSPEASQLSQVSTPDDAAASNTDPNKSSADLTKPSRRTKPDLPKSGVECVFLHGSLEQLRCFLCGRVCSWDDDERENETMCGQQPECPHCVGATAAREERGKRALGVGKLRPDIVLYGEEHPNAHLISPIVTHDLALCPDMLLILGTSLRVHGLKIMVREFAKAVHAKGGKVVFVNFTKPPESSWGEIIDYWVQWDCDAWVSDLQQRIPKLWQDPEPPKPKKKRDSAAGLEGGSSKPEKPPPANPVAIRDTKVTGAHYTLKIVDELHRITGEPPRSRRASIAASKTKAGTEVDGGAPETGAKPARKPRSRAHRRSAPGVLEQQPKKLGSSTLNPDHGRPQRSNDDESLEKRIVTTVTPNRKNLAKTEGDSDEATHSSILDSVKRNARTRKRKKIDGVEVVMPTVGSRRTSAPVTVREDLKLAPIRPERAHLDRRSGSKLQIMEPKSPPPGPLSSISPNMRSARVFGMEHSFYLQDPLVKHGPTKPIDFGEALRPGPRRSRGGAVKGSEWVGGQGPKVEAGVEDKTGGADGEAKRAADFGRLTSVHGSGRTATTRATQQLAQWGSNWNCKP
ncbi:sir2 family protein [Sarocladium implicatum]|nr:sir2 family protein [Sarocladium implicatum]